MNINVAIDLPDDVEARLRVEDAELSKLVREVYATELFRRGVLSHHALGQTLGLDRFETDALLKHHRVTEYSLTHEDVDADVESFEESEFVKSADP